MNNRLIILFFFFIISLDAQVGIGTKTPSSDAILDVQGGDKGLLVPKVSLLSTSDMVTVQVSLNSDKGLLVYNIADNGSGDLAVKANNHYAWNGTKWLQLSNLKESEAAVNALSTSRIVYRGAAALGTAISASINTVTHFPLSFSTAVDEFSAFSGNKFTVPETGFYNFKFTSSIEQTIGNAGDKTYSGVILNTTTGQELARAGNSGSGGNAILHNTIFWSGELQENDIIEFRAEGIISVSGETLRSASEELLIIKYF